MDIAEWFYIKLFPPFAENLYRYKELGEEDFQFKLRKYKIPQTRSGVLVHCEKLLQRYDPTSLNNTRDQRKEIITDYLFLENLIHYLITDLDSPLSTDALLLLLRFIRGQLVISTYEEGEGLRPLFTSITPGKY